MYDEALNFLEEHIDLWETNQWDQLLEKACEYMGRSCWSPYADNSFWHRCLDILLDPEIFGIDELLKNMTAIPDYFFSGYQSKFLADVTIPANIKKIGTEAFGYTDTVNITFAATDSVVLAGTWVWDTQKLKKIDFSRLSVLHFIVISGYSPILTSGGTIIVPNNCNGIGFDRLWDASDTAPIKIYFKANTPEEITCDCYYIPKDPQEVHNPIHCYSWGSKKFLGDLKDIAKEVRGIY